MEGRSGGAGLGGGGEGDSCGQRRGGLVGGRRWLQRLGAAAVAANLHNWLFRQTTSDDLTWGMHRGDLLALRMAVGGPATRGELQLGM